MSSTQQRIDTTAPTEGGALTSNLAPQLTPPPAQFNFAQHLLDANAARAEKVAYIDDAGRLTYGELAPARPSLRRRPSRPRAAARRTRAAAMLDSSDWPVAFLGALYAGVVPWPSTRCSPRANTPTCSSTAARRRPSSPAPLLPTLQSAMARSAHELRATVVSRGERRRRARSISNGCSLEREPARRPAATARTTRRSGSIRPARPAGRRAPCTRTPTRTGPRSFTARRSSGLTERDRLLLGGEALLRLRTRQRADLPALGRRVRRAHGRAADAGRDVQASGAEHAADGLLRRADRLTPAMLASPALPTREHVALRVCCSSAGEALPRRYRRALHAAFRLRHHRRHRLDGDAAHLHLQPRRRRALRHDRQAGAGLRNRAARRGRARRSPTAKSAICYIHGPSAALMYWGEPREDRARPSRARGRKSGDKYVRDARRLLHLRRPRRRHAEGERPLRLAVRGRGGARAAPGRARSGGDRRSRRRRSTKTKAFVVLKEASDASDTRRDLKAFVKDRLAPYKYPRPIEFLPSCRRPPPGRSSASRCASARLD